MDSQLDEIKSRLNITEVLADYIQLRKAGTNFKAVCPFHTEKTPSFVISPVKQIWHCFGCGLGGDIFEFIKQIENVEFSQALRILADRAGVELRKPSITELKMIDEKEVLVEINEQAAVYFQKVLWESKAGAEALDYLRKRGLSDKTIKLWQLGFAPEDFHFLENFLSKKYKKTQIAAAGLIIKKDSDGPLATPSGSNGGQGSFFDRFRGRIMFPICSIQGEVVGFTGRILKDKENTGKYVNSPETPIYNKSEIIYGLYQAKQNIRKENRAILVEGNMDVIACHQAGFIQTIASSGTAITLKQLQTLQRLCENLIFAFDSDTAGNAATKRALEAALSLGFNVKIVELGAAKDPDELIKKGIGIWQKAVDGSVHYVEFFFNTLLKQHDPNSVDGKRLIAKELAPLIYHISDSITRAHFVRKLSTTINIPEQTILDLIGKINLPKPSAQPQKQVLRKDKKTVLEEQVLGLSINLNDLEILKDFEETDFDESNREILRALKSFGPKDVPNLKKSYPNLAGQFDLLSFSSQVETEQQGLEPKQELVRVGNELKKLTIKRKMEVLAGLLAEAEKARNKPQLLKLMDEFKALSGKLTQIP